MSTLEELVEQINKAIEEVPQRYYPESCQEGSFVNYVDGVADGLKEARQLIQMRIAIPKILYELEDKEESE